MDICSVYRSILFLYALRDVFRPDYPGLHCRENSRLLLEIPEYTWCARAPKDFALFDYLDKDLIYDVRSTIYDFKSQIVNTVSSTSGTRIGCATAAAAGTALWGGIASTAAYRHSKHRKYLVDAVTLAGRTKQLFPFRCAPKIFVKFRVTLITLKFVYWHN